MLVPLVLLCMSVIVDAQFTRKTQREVGNFLDENANFLRTLGVPFALQPLVKQAAKKWSVQSLGTICKWYRDFELYAEFPYQVKKRIKKLLERANMSWTTVREILEHGDDTTTRLSRRSWMSTPSISSTSLLTSWYLVQTIVYLECADEEVRYSLKHSFGGQRRDNDDDGDDIDREEGDGDDKEAPWRHCLP